MKKIYEMMKQLNNDEIKISFLVLYKLYKYDYRTAKKIFIILMQ